MQRTILAWGRSAPGTAAGLVLLLLLGIVGFWRKDAGAPRPVATLARVQARLADGAQCEFSADIELASRWGRVLLGLREGTVRSAFVDLVRTKTHYMVSTSTARESLRAEMLIAVNRVIGSGNATAVRLSAFQLS